MTGWTLDIKNMSWVERTVQEVDFVIEALGLRGGERMLDLACGYGRHSLELARRGYAVVGVDYTPAYIEDARLSAEREHLAVEFVEADVLQLSYDGEFDVVLNMADGAIGYFATEEENLRLFDVIATALRPGGKHVMGVCSADHARKHFPKRHWEAGSHSLSLADFVWREDTSRMIYRGHVLPYGEPLQPLSDSWPADGDPGTRLYGLAELKGLLGERGMRIIAAYGDYDAAIPASAEHLMLVVCSQKAARP